MFRADGLPENGSYLKRLSCEFRFLNRGNSSIKTTRVLIRTKTESNLRTRNFHCDMPIRHLKYETCADRPDRRVEGQFTVSLVHTMDDREGSKRELANSRIRLIYCSTVNLCTYCSGLDVCMWANGKCTTRIEKETGDTIAEDCPKWLSENDQPGDFQIVKIDRKDHSERPPFEVVLYTYNLKPDADVSQLAVSAGPYFCENLTKTENQTLTCSFLGIRNAGSIFITVANRTSNEAVICRSCQLFISSSEPPLFSNEEILLFVAVTVGPVALLFLLISLLHVRDKLRKEKAAKNSLGKFKYIAIEQARTSEILQTA
ncbi:hypothetical protein RvY_02194-3 [Ramazzottius varieornatus]|uniref:Uncharacterized protein n=1 Tax=Ramazzottius varieornatus TaxID=947166 RepID=A0A1D1UIX0_RAMVA|nr:hypothetical protein RvY_02194-3 [Ramazzottius varieornatus]